jgi:hypothetical protein
MDHDVDCVILNNAVRVINISVTIQSPVIFPYISVVDLVCEFFRMCFMNWFTVVTVDALLFMHHSTLQSVHSSSLN